MKTFIGKIIEYCAKNQFIVFVLVGVAALAGFLALKSLPLDAIPDLSDTQVIIYSRWDRSPDIIEDQVTYPIVTSMLGAPKVKAIRGFSDFGFSYVYIILDNNAGTNPEMCANPLKIAFLFHQLRHIEKPSPRQSRQALIQLLPLRGGA